MHSNFVACPVPRSIAHSSNRAEGCIRNCKCSCIYIYGNVSASALAACLICCSCSSACFAFSRDKFVRVINQTFNILQCDEIIMLTWRPDKPRTESVSCICFCFCFSLFRLNREITNAIDLWPRQSQTIAILWREITSGKCNYKIVIDME